MKLIHSLTNHKRNGHIKPPVYSNTFGRSFSFSNFSKLNSSSFKTTNNVPKVSKCISKSPCFERSSRSFSKLRIPRPSPSSRVPVAQDPLFSGSNSQLQAVGNLQELMKNNTLIVTREIEWGQILIGFEQANKYSLKNEQGTIVGFLAEEGGLGRTFGRQLMRTHRNFLITVFDAQGLPLLKLHRPPYLIRSNILIDTIQGEVSMQWHLYKRRYNLYLKSPEGNSLNQFAHIDGGFLEWDFVMRDESGNSLGSVNKDWRGLAKELFTDANQYIIRLTGDGRARPLSLSERCVALGTAITVDFDYFSRTSGGIIPIPWLLPTPIPPDAPPVVPPAPVDLPSSDPTGSVSPDPTFTSSGEKTFSSDGSWTSGSAEASDDLSGWMPEVSTPSQGETGILRAIWDFFFD